MRSWLASVGLVCAGLACVDPAPAFAQAPPTPLFAPQPPARPAPGVRIDPPAGASQTLLPQERVRPRPPTVTSRPLAALDYESAGWSAAEGGFAPTLWQGSSWAAAGRLLDRLSAPSATPVRHALARRLLMSAAARPEGAPAGAFLEARLARLLALGDAPAAMALVRAVPEGRLDGARARLAAEAALLAGAGSDACKLARRGEIDLSDLFWRRLLLACDAADGHGDRVTLGLDLLRDQGHDAGEAFSALLQGAVGQGEKPRITAGLDAVTLFVALKAGAEIAPEAVAKASAGIAAAVARAELPPIELRLAAGERAAAHGLVDGRLLAQLYSALPLPPERLAEPPAEAARRAGADARAALFQAARLEIVPARRLERLALGWQQAREGKAALAFAAAAAPLVREVSPSMDLVDHAAAAIRIALAAGDGKTAMRWLAMIGQRPGNARAMEMHAAAAPLVRLALGDEGPAWNADAVRRWSAGMGGPGTPRAAIGLALLAALGDLAASDEWIALAHDPARPLPPPPAVSTALWFAQEAAARDGREGEQVALALIVLGADPVPHPLAAFSAFNGLRLAEEGAVARRMAVEIALLAGL